LPEPALGNEWRVESCPDYDEAADQCDDVRRTLVLALVELRLKSPGDKEDRSGLTVARAIRQKYGVPVILMACDRPDNGLVEEWKQANDIDDFLLIRSSYDKRWNDIDEILKNHIRVNKHLKTPYDNDSEGWVALARKVNRGESGDAPEGVCSGFDLAHLFHRLFPIEVERFSLEDISGGAGDAATARANVLHRGYPTEETLVIKYGEKSIVHSEEEKFRQYIEQLGPRGVAQIRWSAQLKRCAAVAYWSVQPRFGGTPAFLSDYLLRPDVHYQRKRDVYRVDFHRRVGAMVSCAPQMGSGWAGQRID